MENVSKSCYILAKEIRGDTLVVERKKEDGSDCERLYLKDVSESGKKRVDETILEMGWSDGTEKWVKKEG